MTEDELQAEFVRLAPIVADVQNDRALISQEQERRLHQANAKVRMLALSDGERAALRTQLNAEAGAVDAVAAAAAQKVATA